MSVYFCDVPSCTLPNRAFLQAASSNGNVTNGGYSGISSWLTNPSLILFDILTEKDVPWKVYHDTKNVIPTSFVINFPHTSVSKAQFVPLEELFHDLEHGSLPAVSFCEPRFLGFPMITIPSIRIVLTTTIRSLLVSSCCFGSIKRFALQN